MFSFFFLIFFLGGEPTTTHEESDDDRTIQNQSCFVFITVLFYCFFIYFCPPGLREVLRQRVGAEVLLRLADTANLPTNIVDFGGVDSSTILI